MIRLFRLFDGESVATKYVYRLNTVLVTNTKRLLSIEIMTTFRRTGTAIVEYAVAVENLNIPISGDNYSL